MGAVLDASVMGVRLLCKPGAVAPVMPPLWRDRQLRPVRFSTAQDGR